jgi:Trk-type K+ transport system membrane component
MYTLTIVLDTLGVVGLSLGVPGETYSLSGYFTNAGKYLVIFTLFLGKSRGLPKVDDELIDFQFTKLSQVLYPSGYRPTSTDSGNRIPFIYECSY